MAIIIEGFFDYISKMKTSVDPLETSDIEKIEDLFLSYINESEWNKLDNTSSFNQILDDPRKPVSCYQFKVPNEPPMGNNKIELEVYSFESFGKIWEKYKKRLSSHKYKIKEKYKHQGPIATGIHGKSYKNGAYLESEYPLYKFEIIISK